MIIGHNKNIKYLKYLSDNHLLFHSYIFFGKQWIGKKTIALALANYLETKEFTNHPKKLLSDLLIIDADKITNNENINGDTILDEVRKIKNFLYQKSNISYYRTVIIDNADKLTTYAQNALLKISEEPQLNSLIILICTDAEILLPTINSRFQKIYFKNLKKEEVKQWLIKEEEFKEFKLSLKQIEEIANISNGFPGFAYLMLKNEDFKNYFKNINLFLNLSYKEKVDFIKKIFQNEDEKFNINLFLDILMFILKNKDDLVNNFQLWKQILKIKQNMSYYNLNSKLQLVALANFMENL